VIQGTGRVSSGDETNLILEIEMARTFSSRGMLILRLNHPRAFCFYHTLLHLH
jgi:hypothetical protein